MVQELNNARVSRLGGSGRIKQKSLVALRQNCARRHNPQPQNEKQHPECRG